MTHTGTEKSIICALSEGIIDCFVDKPAIASCWQKAASIKFVSLMSLVMSFWLPTNRTWERFSQMIYYKQGCRYSQNSNVFGFSPFCLTLVASSGLCLVWVMISLRAAAEELIYSAQSTSWGEQEKWKCQGFSQCWHTWAPALWLHFALRPYSTAGVCFHTLLIRLLWSKKYITC